jgi:hypothetical protein
MKNIHVIQTDKPSRLAILGMSNTLQLFDKPITFHNFGRSPQNIYITNSEEIKEGDWFLTKTNDVLKVQKPEKGYEPIGKKIILTDNKDLIKDGVQAIDDEFLEWFVKNPSCEFVKVEKEDWMITADLEFIYEIIIPKQETVEDACDRVLNYLYPNCKKEMSSLQYGNSINSLKSIAKWQQERSYSDEEIKQAFKVGFSIGYGSDVHAIDEKNRTCEEWFEKNKKK